MPPFNLPEATRRPQPTEGTSTPTDQSQIQKQQEYALAREGKSDVYRYDPDTRIYAPKEQITSTTPSMVTIGGQTMRVDSPASRFEQAGLKRETIAAIQSMPTGAKVSFDEPGKSQFASTPSPQLQALGFQQQLTSAQLERAESVGLRGVTQTSLQQAGESAVSSWILSGEGRGFETLSEAEARRARSVFPGEYRQGSIVEKGGFGLFGSYVKTGDVSKLPEGGYQTARGPVVPVQYVFKPVESASQSQQVLLMGKPEEARVVFRSDDQGASSPFADYSAAVQRAFERSQSDAAQAEKTGLFGSLIPKDVRGLLGFYVYLPMEVTGEAFKSFSGGSVLVGQQLAAFAKGETQPTAVMREQLGLASRVGRTAGQVAGVVPLVVTPAGVVGSSIASAAVEPDERVAALNVLGGFTLGFAGKALPAAAAYLQPRAVAALSRVPVVGSQTLVIPASLKSGAQVFQVGLGPAVGYAGNVLQLVGPKIATSTLAAAGAYSLGEALVASAAGRVPEASERAYSLGRGLAESAGGVRLGEAGFYATAGRFLIDPEIRVLSGLPARDRPEVARQVVTTEPSTISGVRGERPITFGKTLSSRENEWLGGGSFKQDIIYTTVNPKGSNIYETAAYFSTKNPITDIRSAFQSPSPNVLLKFKDIPTTVVSKDLAAQVYARTDIQAPVSLGVQSQLRALATAQAAKSPTGLIATLPPKTAGGPLGLNYLARLESEAVLVLGRSAPRVLGQQVYTWPTTRVSGIAETPTGFVPVVTIKGTPSVEAPKASALATASEFVTSAIGRVKSTAETIPKTISTVKQSGIPFGQKVTQSPTYSVYSFTSGAKGIRYEPIVTGQKTIYRTIEQVSPDVSYIPTATKAADIGVKAPEIISSIEQRYAMLATMRNLAPYQSGVQRAFVKSPTGNILQVGGLETVPFSPNIGVGKVVSSFSSRATSIAPEAPVSKPAYGISGRLLVTEPKFAIESVQTYPVTRYYSGAKGSLARYAERPYTYPTTQYTTIKLNGYQYPEKPYAPEMVPAYPTPYATKYPTTYPTGYELPTPKTYTYDYPVKTPTYYTPTFYRPQEAAPYQPTASYSLPTPTAYRPAAAEPYQAPPASIQLPKVTQLPYWPDQGKPVFQTPKITTTKARAGYVPSVLGIVTGTRGKAPARLSGLEVRPVELKLPRLKGF